MVCTEMMKDEKHVATIEYLYKFVKCTILSSCKTLCIVSV